MSNPDLLKVSFYPTPLPVAGIDDNVDCDWWWWSIGCRGDHKCWKTQKDYSANSRLLLIRPHITLFSLGQIYAPLLLPQVLLKVLTAVKYPTCSKNSNAPKMTFKTLNYEQGSTIIFNLRIVLASYIIAFNFINCNNAWNSQQTIISLLTMVHSPVN